MPNRWRRSSVHDGFRNALRFTLRIRARFHHGTRHTERCTVRRVRAACLLDDMCELVGK
jgi:hypothetical protein